MLFSIVTMLIQLALIIGSMYILRFVYDKIASNPNNNGNLTFDIKNKNTRWVALAVYAISCVGCVASNSGAFRFFVARLMTGAVGLIIACAGLKIAMKWLMIEPTEENEFLYPIGGIMIAGIVICGVLGIVF